MIQLVPLECFSHIHQDLTGLLNLMFTVYILRSRTFLSEKHFFFTDKSIKAISQILNIHYKEYY